MRTKTTLPDSFSFSKTPIDKTGSRDEQHWMEAAERLEKQGQPVAALMARNQAFRVNQINSEAL
jgi:hypothetical protein